jgi:DNA-binding XRE family transcriptional regulator
MNDVLSKGKAPKMVKQIQMQEAARNPLRRWLADQPLTITQATMARQLGIARNSMSQLMHDDNPKMPSLPLAMKIEALTSGQVTAAELFDYITAKRVA